MLTDLTIFNHELLETGADIIICSYEFVERSYSAKMTHKSNEKTPEHAMGRNKAALHSDFWMCLPIKLLVLDECQKIKNPNGKRHATVKALFTSSVLLMSGTFIANRWEDLGALVPFIWGQPFRTQQQFRNNSESRTASSNVAGPNGVQIRAIQKLLMAFTIARSRTPSS